MKRVKSTQRRCANPLFEKWLKEWRDEASAKGSSVENHFTKAIESLQKYPLPLATGRDCILLQHFGVKLCAMLDKRLKKHLDSKREGHHSDTERGDNCDDLENDILPKKSRSFEGTAFAEKKNNFVPKKKTSFTENRGDDGRAGVSKENVLGESSTRAAHVSPVRAESPAKTKSNRIQRRSRVHSISSSDSEEPSRTPVVESIGRIDDETSERSLGLAAVSNGSNDNGKVTKKAQAKKRVQEKNAAGSNALTKTAEDADNGVNDQFQMAPGTFDVVLLVDTHETSGGKTKSRDDPTISELDRLNTPYEVRSLKIGDFAWVARCRDTKKELVLPYTVERKRMDDLASSIKDGRFHEQKFRLRQSGIPNVIYMIENYGRNQHLGLPLPTLLQAATNSQVQDGFVVKYTDNHKHSMEYLSILTSLIHKIFKDKHLRSSSKDDLDPHCIVSSKVSLMEFKQFNKAATKTKTFKVREMFIRHLLQLKGISVEKALAIVDLYPTPAVLTQAFRNAGEGGEKLLAGIKVGSLKRQLGPALSKTVFDLYTKRSLD